MALLAKSGVIMNRTQIAVDFIKECCPSIGRLKETDDVNKYLKETASEMASSKPSVVFPQRYIEHVAYAIDMVASNNVLTPPSAIASVYLATRFEFYFRILSGKLNGDGTWLSTLSDSEYQTAKKKFKNIPGRNKQLSDVALTYKLMKLDQSRKIVRVCTDLDNSLYSSPQKVVGSKVITDIGDRIKFMRDATGHGHSGDISSEALFYGLMTALVFYNQN
jgi:hypothetical protein